MKSTFACMFRLLSLATFCMTAVAVAEDRRPNVVVILADDFGVGDIQAHFPENKIATPHLDRLVREGMSFTDAHSPSAVCSPTRYGLLTGRYNWRTRLQEWVIAAYEPPLIAAERPTLPGMLRQQGYRTGCIGKWHLGWDWPGRQPSRMTEQRNGQAFLTWDFTQPIQGGPTARGFDDFFGVDLPNLPPFTFIEGDRARPLPTDRFQPDSNEGIVLPRRFAGTPAAPDWRMQDVLPTITERAVRYIHDRAREHSPFCLYFSLTSPHEPVVPSPKFKGKSGIAPIADFVMETDWSVGEVMKAIDAAGIADRTIVIFTADNGHSHYTGWQDLVDAGHQPSGPYRGHKGDIWEGGHRVPLVVRWPGHIEPAAKSDQLVCLTDLFATCADIVGARLPPDGAEDSLSFLPALLGNSPEAGRTSVVSHSNFGEFAYRDGPWKLVYKMSGPNLEASRGKPTIAELYHLPSTIDETEDLSTRHPEIVARMTRDLEQVIRRGASRPGIAASNDTEVRFDTTQTQRWAPAPDRRGPTRLRVLSYNIHHAEGVDRKLDLQRIARVILSADPDLVALQEVDRKVKRTEAVDQAAELARLTNMNVAFGANIKLQGGHYGNAVLSRHPIIRFRNHLLPNVNDGEQRGVLDAEIGIPGSDELLRLLATHLDHRTDDGERVASANAINQLVSEQPQRPTLLAGDLNDTHDSRTLVDLANLWMRTNSTPIPTIPVDQPTRQIDFILCQPANRWKVLETKVLDEKVASDHRAIMTALELIPARAREERLDSTPQRVDP